MHVGGLTIGGAGAAASVAFDAPVNVSGDVDVDTGSLTLNEAGYAVASIRPAGGDNDLLITASDTGGIYSDVVISFVASGNAGTVATADYNPANKTLIFTLDDSADAAAVIDSLDAVPEFTASLDGSVEAGNTGLGVVLPTAADPAARGVTTGGRDDAVLTSGGTVTVTNTGPAVLNAMVVSGGNVPLRRHRRRQSRGRCACGRSRSRVYRRGIDPDAHGRLPDRYQ